MKVETTYEAVKARYPVIVDELVAKLRAGKSKHRDAKPEDLTWYFNVGLVIEGSGSFAQVLAGLGKPKPAENFPTLEEDVADHCRRSLVGLHASIGRWWAGSSNLASCPAEVEAHWRAGCEKIHAEKARVAALTPEQRDAEREAALKERWA